MTYTLEYSDDEINWTPCCGGTVKIKAQEVFIFDAANKSRMVDTKTGFRFANFAQKNFSYLNVKPFKVVNVKKEKLCHFQCVKEQPSCVSYNVAVLPNPANGLYECQLLDKHMFNAEKNLVVDQRFHHFVLETRCLSRPCKNNGMCLPNFVDDTYSCNCSSLVFGKHCEKECSKPLGMEDGSIKDSQITASSYFNVNYYPYYGRLNRVDRGEWAWIPKSNDAGEYLQIDLGTKHTVTKVATQGRHGCWTMTYTLEYSDDEINWTPCCEETVKKFQGNIDNSAVVTNVLDSPITARHVRFVPEDYTSFKAMRVEIYGCLQSGDNHEFERPAVD